MRLHWLCSYTGRHITYCFSYQFMSFVLFLVSVCLLSLPVLLVYRMNNESMGELISPWKAASNYWEERYIEKNCLDDFSSKLFYSSNPQLWGCVVISVAIAFKDNDIHPWPKGCCGLLYCTFASVCVHRESLETVHALIITINGSSTMYVSFSTQPIQEKQQGGSSSSLSPAADLLCPLWQITSSERDVEECHIFLPVEVFIWTY